MYCCFCVHSVWAFCFVWWLFLCVCFMVVLVFVVVVVWGDFITNYLGYHVRKMAKMVVWSTWGLGFLCHGKCQQGSSFSVVVSARWYLAGVRRKGLGGRFKKNLLSPIYVWAGVPQKGLGDRVISLSPRWCLGRCATEGARSTGCCFFFVPWVMFGQVCQRWERWAWVTQSVTHNCI